MKKLLILFICSLFCLSACTQDIVYSVTKVNDQLDTVTYFVNVRGSLVDTILPARIRKYKPPTNPPSSITFTPSVIPLSDIDVIGAGRGANQFYGGNGSQTNLPSTSSFDYLDNDTRYYWAQLQSGSTPNFTQLDNDIKTAIAKGGKLSFRVMTCDPGYTGTVLPYSSSKVPDFNSETYLAAYTSFVSAMAAHLNSTGLIKGVYKIDIGGIGNWSEGHWYGISVPVLTTTNVKRIISAYTTGFPNTWLMITISMLTPNSSLATDAAFALLSSSNNLGKVGIRSDHLGDAGNLKYDIVDISTVYNGVNFKTEILNRWKTSPMAGELMNDLNKINSSNPYNDLTYESGQYHLSQFSNNNWCRVSTAKGGPKVTAAQIASSDINIRAASKLTGYRISISKAVITTDSSGTHLTITWNNSGNAPTYENWDLYIIAGTQQIKSSFNIKTLLPGTGTSTDNIPSGNYSLSIIIKDPSGVRKPFTLVNTGRGTDGSYKIGDK